MTQAETILRVTGVSKSFGGIQAVQNVSFDLRAGEIVALIGPNGAGKTTLINQISGMMKPDGGQILFNGSDITHMSASRRCHAGLVRSFQITSILKNFSVAENVSLGIQARQGHSFKFWKPVKNDAALKEPVLKILSALGLGERAGVLAGNLAHGEQRQLEIAMALATAPKMLLLDEPMAGMNHEEKEDMCRYILDVNEQFGTTIVLIEHDMSVVMDISDRVVVLDYGEKIADGNPDEVRGNQRVIDAYLGVQHD